MSRRYRLFAVVGVLTIVLDQLTKWWARHELIHAGTSVTLIDGYWDWRLSFNTGSAFGMFAGQNGSRVFLSIVGVAATIAILFILRRAKDEQKWMTTALALVAGGAIGNVIDRIMYGKVTDFVVWKVGKTEWPAFNIADCALVVGVAIMFLDVGREQRKQKETAAVENLAEKKGRKQG
jgi:signal peptidase II